jgi:cytochrome c oxidase subunit 1
MAYNSTRPLMPLASTLTSPLTPPASVAAPPELHAIDTTASHTVSSDVRRWCGLAIGSLVIAGLLSLAVVVGRLPVLSRLIDDPLFFKRCLVVHVDLALVVWFYAFLAALLAFGTRSRSSPMGIAACTLAVGGVVGMLGGALMRGAQPVLANYVPVIDHPLFGVGLAAFFTGTLLQLVSALGAPRRGSAVPEDALIGLQAAAVAVAIAAATWVSARAGLPAGTDVHTRAEFLAWGPGHVLQAANACAMLAVWLWLLERITGTPVLSPQAARLVFGALVLPQMIMPLLTVRGTLDTLYHTGATRLMRWGIFPAILVVLVVGLNHLRMHRAAPGRRSPAGRVALTGFAASALLALLGMVLGFCIRGSTTLVPAHYHAALGAVTVAFMSAAYFLCEGVRPLRVGSTGSDRLEQGITPADLTSNGLTPSLWRAARRQLALFGVGQAIFALGFAVGGAYGLGRKAYAAEQHVRSAGELCGLIVMGLGGLVAATGGLWFLFLVLREMRAWWPARSTCAAASPVSTLL